MAQIMKQNSKNFLQPYEKNKTSRLSKCNNGKKIDTLIHMLCFLLTVFSTVALADQTFQQAEAHRSLQLVEDIIFDDADWDYWLFEDELDLCVPQLLLSSVLEDQVYTVTDDAIMYKFPQFTSFPDDCEVEYFIDSKAASVVKVNSTLTEIKIEAFNDDLNLYVPEAKYDVTLQAKIGSFFSIAAEATFELTLRNPCFDENFVKITEAELPKISDYSVKTPERFWTFPEFKVDTTLSENYFFCGELVYELAINGVVLTNATEPVNTVGQSEREIRVFTDTQEDLGLQSVSVQAYFSRYPDVRTEIQWTYFGIVYDPCAFETLKLQQEKFPFGDTFVLLFDKAKTFRFDLDKLVTRATTLNCGNLLIDFTVSVKDEALKKSIKQVFSWDASSFTIKSLPINGQDLVGFYTVNYYIYLQDFPLVLLSDKEIQKMEVQVFDPCSVKDIKLKPVICFTKAYIKDRMPKWMAELEDQVVAFGHDYTYEMGQPLDNFNSPIQVEVNMRKAKDFITFSQPQNSLIVTGSKMVETHVPIYKVTVETVFVDIFGTEQYFKKDVHFLLVHLNFPINLKEEIMFAGDPTMDFSLPRIDNQYNLVNDGKIPKVFIVGKSQKGEIRLGFSEKMRAPYKRDLDRVLTDRVSIHADQAYKDSIVIFDREPREYIRVIVKNSTDVTFLPADDSDVKLTDIKMQDFKKHEMTMQVVFDKPSLVDYEDLIRVTLWNPELYTTLGSPAAILPGTEIFIRIALQIDDESRVSLDSLLYLFLILAVILIICSLVIQIVFKRRENFIVPLWMSLNSLQLIAYAVLIDMPVPANAAYLMRRILDTLRFQFSEDLQGIEESEVRGYEEMITGQNSFDRLHLQVLGYSPWLSPNCGPILVLLAILCTLALGVILATVALSKKGKKKRNVLRLVPKMSNILARFVYFYFLELCLCSVLCLSLTFTTRDKVTQYIEIVCAGTLLTALLTFVGLFIFRWRNVTMHSTPTYDPRRCGNTLSQFFCCWEKRLLKEDLIGPQNLVTEEEMASLEQYSQVVQKHKFIIKQVEQFQIQLKSKTVDRRDQGRMSQSKVISAKSSKTSSTKGKRRKKLKEAGLVLPQIETKRNSKKIDVKKLVMPDDNFEGGEEELEDLEQNLPSQQNTSRNLIEEEKTPSPPKSLISEEKAISSPLSPIEEEKTPGPAKPLSKEACKRLERDNAILARNEQMTLNTKEARMRLIIQDKVILNPTIKTLFIGLKLNHPENVASWHPVFFMVRRLLYVVGIVLSAQYGIVTAALMQFTCLIQLCFLCSQRQWEEPLVNLQHFVNEMAFYLTLCSQLACSVGMDSASREQIGTATIVLISMTFFWNFTICSYRCVHQVLVQIKKFQIARKKAARKARLFTEKKEKELKSQLTSNSPGENDDQHKNTNNALFIEHESQDQFTKDLKLKEGSELQPQKIILQQIDTNEFSKSAAAAAQLESQKADVVEAADNLLFRAPIIELQSQEDREDDDTVELNNRQDFDPDRDESQDPIKTLKTLQSLDEEDEMHGFNSATQVKEQQNLKFLKENTAGLFNALDQMMPGDGSNATQNHSSMNILLLNLAEENALVGSENNSRDISKENSSEIQRQQNSKYELKETHISVENDDLQQKSIVAFAQEDPEDLPSDNEENLRKSIIAEMSEKAEFTTKDQDDDAKDERENMDKLEGFERQIPSYEDACLLPNCEDDNEFSSFNIIDRNNKKLQRQGSKTHEGGKISDILFDVKADHHENEDPIDNLFKELDQKPIKHPPTPIQTKRPTIPKETLQKQLSGGKNQEKMSKWAGANRRRVVGGNSSVQAGADIVQSFQRQPSKVDPAKKETNEPQRARYLQPAKAEPQRARYLQPAKAKPGMQASAVRQDKSSSMKQMASKRKKNEQQEMDSSQAYGTSSVTDIAGGTSMEMMQNQLISNTCADLRQIDQDIFKSTMPLSQRRLKVGQSPAQDAQEIKFASMQNKVSESARELRQNQSCVNTAESRDERDDRETENRVKALEKEQEKKTKQTKEEFLAKIKATNDPRDKERLIEEMMKKLAQVDAAQKKEKEEQEARLSKMLLARRASRVKNKVQVIDNDLSEESIQVVNKEVADVKERLASENQAMFNVTTASGFHFNEREKDDIELHKIHLDKEKEKELKDAEEEIDQEASKSAHQMKLEKDREEMNRRIANEDDFGERKKLMNQLQACEQNLGLQMAQGRANQEKDLQEKLKRRQKLLQIKKLQIEADQIDQLNDKEVEMVNTKFNKQMNDMDGHLDKLLDKEVNIILQRPGLGSEQALTVVNEALDELLERKLRKLMNKEISDLKNLMGSMERKLQAEHTIRTRQGEVKFEKGKEEAINEGLNGWEFADHLETLEAGLDLDNELSLQMMDSERVEKGEALRENLEEKFCELKKDLVSQHAETKILKLKQVMEKQPQNAVLQEVGKKLIDRNIMTTKGELEASLRQQEEAKQLAQQIKQLHSLRRMGSKVKSKSAW